MKKILLFLLFSGIAQAQIVNIPDEDFKAKLLFANSVSQVAFAGGVSVKIDTNNDSEIQVSEAQVIDSLNVSNHSIEDLTGIAAFSNLKKLDCSFNLLTALDLSAQTSLTKLECKGNYLSTINITQMPNLEYLECSNNQIAIIDFSASGNLKTLKCSDNAITSFNFTGLASIEYIDCTSNNLGSLDVTVLTTLKRLYCAACNLTNLNLAGMANLEWLICEGNPLGSINTSGLSGLKYFAPTNCGLTALDLTGLDSLIELNCSGNSLTTLNLSVIPNLDSLFCEYNLITDIDFSSSIGLRQLLLSHNLFTYIDLSQCSNLLGVNVTYNPQLEMLNIKNGSLQGNAYWENPALSFICTDDFEIEATETVLSNAAISGVTVSSYCSFEPGGPYNTITGVANLDTDNNGCDSSDMKMRNVKIAINDGTTEGATFTNVDGIYSFSVQQPNFTLTTSVENPSYFTVSPASLSVSFPDNGYHTEIRDLCVTANGVHPDADIVIIPILQPRPGFDVLYDIIYTNKGNQTLSGNVNFIFDDAVLDFDWADVAPDTQVINNLTWNYTTLLPFESRTIRVRLNVNSPIETPAVNIGDTLNLTAIVNPISGDETPEDNTFALKQTVVGSLDPNDKHCLQGAIVPPTQIGNYLFYVINFENTGNFPAEKVAIKDLIDATKFDINSFQMLGHSHNVQPVITGNRVEFFFDDINLSPNEYGYVGYKIKTLGNLPVGTTVTNTAAIYFDFNAPVVTNTVSTTFQSLGVAENIRNSTVSVYPNPANTFVRVNSEIAIQALSIFDVQGRLVKSQSSNETEVVVDIASLTSGVYLLKVQSGERLFTQKIVKQ